MIYQEKKMQLKSFLFYTVEQIAKIILVLFKISNSKDLY